MASLIKRLFGSFPNGREKPENIEPADFERKIMEKAMDMVGGNPSAEKRFNEEEKVLRELTDKLAKKIASPISNIENNDDKKAFATTLLINLFSAKYNPDIIFATQYKKTKETGSVLNTVLTVLVLAKLGLINENEAFVWIAGENSAFFEPRTFPTFPVKEGLIILDITPYKELFSPVGSINESSYKETEIEGKRYYVLTNTQQYFGNSYLDVSHVSARSLPIDYDFCHQIALLFIRNIERGMKDLSPEIISSANLKTEEEDPMVKTYTRNSKNRMQ